MGYEKKPINFAVESLCPENLSALLHDPSVCVDFKCSSLTPINYLTQHISDDNFRKVHPCIKLLVEHCADINIPNDDGDTPIQNILKNEKLKTDNQRLLVTCLFTYSKYIDIDNDGSGKLRNQLKELLPSLELLPNRNDRSWNFSRLAVHLRDRNESQFIQGINFVATNRPDQLAKILTTVDKNETLLSLAIKEDLKFSVERMLRLGADIDAKAKSIDPLRRACESGHSEILDLLLRSSQLESVNSELLPLATRKLSKSTNPASDYVKCFELLLNHRKVDVNAADSVGCTALHYAIHRSNSNVVHQLLKRGAYIGCKNASKTPSIFKIDPTILEKHFDSCITTNGKDSDDKDFEVIFDLTNVIPKECQANSTNHWWNIFNGCEYETKSIEYVLRSSEIKYLVRHPLIASFLWWKFDRLKWFYVLNIVLFLVFSASCISTILFRIFDSQNTFNSVSLVVAQISFVCLLIREAFQFIFAPLNYLKNINNYLELLLLLFLSIAMFDSEYIYHRDELSLIILLIAYEIFSLIGSIPFWSLSTYYLMLTTVAKSFFKCFLLYSIMVVAFVLSFFVLYNDPEKEFQAVNKDEEDFKTFGTTIFKTVAMAIGELNVSGFDISSRYFVFTAFIFLIPIVLMNLFNGLAVSDTQAIKSKAKLMELIQLCQTFSRCAINRFGYTNLRANHIKLFPNKKVKFLDLYRMNNNIIKDAFQVLAKVEREKNDEKEKEKFEARLTNIEESIDLIRNFVEKSFHEVHVKTDSTSTYYSFYLK